MFQKDQKSIVASELQFNTVSQTIMNTEDHTMVIVDINMNIQLFQTKTMILTLNILLITIIQQVLIGDRSHSFFTTEILVSNARAGSFVFVMISP